MLNASLLILTSEIFVVVVVVSIVGLFIMATLFLHELSYYLNTLTVHQVRL